MIINFHFLQHSLLEHYDLISCKYFVTFNIIHVIPPGSSGSLQEIKTISRTP